MNRLRAPLLGLWLALAACNNEPAPADAGLGDAGAGPDAGTVDDAGLPDDAGAPQDAGVDGGSAPDGGDDPDGGAGDAGPPPDAGWPWDGGAIDGGATSCDAGTVLCLGVCEAPAPSNGCGASACAPCVPPDGGASDCGGVDGLTCIGTCPLGQKVCGGACVAKTPANGCGAEGCAACSLANVSAALCTTEACDYVTCAPGFEDLDGVRGNGCEAAVCTTGTKRCPDGSCKATTPANGCGVEGTCDACPVVQPVATAACVSDGAGSTRCGVGTCEADFRLCGRECVGITRPEYGCGNCGTCQQQVQNAIILFCTDQGECDYTSCTNGYSDQDGIRSNGCEAPPATCAAGQKSCGTFSVCRDNPYTGCGGASCASCPPPTSGFGFAICEGTTPSCGVGCNPGYKRCGTNCASAGNPDFGCDGTSCATCASTVQNALVVGCYGAPGATRCGYFACKPGWFDLDGNRLNGCEARTPDSVRPDALQLWLNANFGFTPGANGMASMHDLSARGRTVSLAYNEFDAPTWAPASSRAWARHVRDLNAPSGAWYPSATTGGPAMLGGEFTVLGTIARQKNETSFVLGVTTDEELFELKVPNPFFPFVPMTVKREWRCRRDGCMSIGFTSGTGFGVRRGMDATNTLVDLAAPVAAVPTGGTQYLRFMVRYSGATGFTITVVDQAGTRTTRTFAGYPAMTIGSARWDYMGLFDGAVLLGDHSAPALKDRYQDGIGELLIYNSALTDPDVATIEQYLQARWGF